MPIFTFEPSVNNEEIFRLALSVNSAVFIVKKAGGGEVMLVVPNARKRVTHCRDLSQAMTLAKVEDDLASKPEVYAVSIQTLGRDLTHLKFFAKAINIRIIAIDAPGESIGVYFVKHKPFDGEILWVKKGDHERISQLIS